MRLNRATVIIAQIVLILGAITMVVPFLWMLSTSFKSLPEVFRFPPTLFGKRIVWENYLHIADRFPFGRFFMNSLKVSVIVTVGQLLTCSMGGFAFARLKFPFRDSLFAMYLATLIIPFHVTLIPVFLMMRAFGWIDTHYSLIIPALVSPFGTFLMRQFFLTIPVELEEAARIDGCTPFGVYWRIFVPLSKPAMATLGLFTFMGTWNDFIRPLIFINSVPRRTLPLGLAALQTMYTTDWPVLMAGSVISVLPVIVVFLFAQEFFIQGITLSGLKG
ncbi:MAG TPA: carbohydrate ABC transporter permease [Firmicutes bacterium]|nr:carbohydrate ABC transporter permease [Bacillota bacterium]